MTDRKLIDWCLTFPDQVAEEIERAEAALADRTDQLQVAEAALAASEAKVAELREALKMARVFIAGVTSARAERLQMIDAALASTATAEEVANAES